MQQALSDLFGAGRSENGTTDACGEESAANECRETRFMAGATPANK